MTGNTDWDWLRSEARAAAKSFGDQLRGVSDTSVRVPNLEWSVAELGAHVASLASVYRTQNDVGDAFRRPQDFSAFSAEARAHITTTDGAELADLLQAEVETLLTDDDPDAGRMLYGRPTTAANLAAAVLTECILHGQDLGRLTGHAPKLGRRQALAGIENMMTLVPVFVDPAKAAPLAGVYGLRFRGGPDFTYRISSAGDLTVERAKPHRADARLIADPAVFLASSLGRISPARAGVTGGIVVYGRKPWRMARLGGIAVDGV